MVAARILSDRYQLGAALGNGNMALVYRGVDLRLHRPIALKLLRPELAADAGFVERFYREARAAAQLHDPRVVSVFDVGRDDGDYYIVMELVDGPTLAEYLRRRGGKLPQSETIAIAIELCGALTVAHNVGVLHRDVKPGNVLMTPEGAAKLADFGLAHALAADPTHTLTRPGTVIGSVAYLSPEQAQGHELTAASDLYSLGVVMYQMLTGQPVFEAESAVAIAVKHVSEEAPRLSPRDASPELAAVVRRLLDKNPAARFASAAAVGVELRRIGLLSRAPADDVPTMVIPTVPGPSRASAPHEASPREAQPRGAPPRKPARFFPRAFFAAEAASLLRRATRRRAATASGAFWTRERVAAAGALAALIAAAKLLGGAAVHGRPAAAPPIAIDSYVGQTKTAAVTAIRRRELVPRVVVQSSESVSAGHVIAQSPRAGSTEAAHTAVVLRVSSGPAFVTVPDLTSVPYETAVRRLRALRLRDDVFTRAAAAPADTVVAQAPEAGARIRPGSRVLLVRSAGPATGDGEGD